MNNIDKPTISDILDYWKNPNDGRNNPVGYLDCDERSEFLLETMNAYANKTDEILEIGCNVGRNLYFLDQAGYERLYGIEINILTKKIMQRHFKFNNNPHIWYKSIEDEYTGKQRTINRHFPRNYQQIFEQYGFKQEYSHIPIDIQGLGNRFVARVMNKY